MNNFKYDMPEGSFLYEEFIKFLEWAVLEVKANDIFVETNEPLGIKKDNVTYNVSEIPLSYDEVASIVSDSRFYETSAAAALMTGKKLLDFAFSMDYGEDKTLRFRVNVTPCNSIESAIKGIEIVLRPTQGVPPTVEELRLPKRFIDTCNFKEGLVLVTGPTGSGKTTMIASLIGHIATTQRKHIITGEEPIEFDFKQIKNRISRINQCEIITNIESFGLFSSNALRRSPDVVFLGELRDARSIEGGTRIAQTGHLVYATGHTNDVASALERFSDEFPFSEKRGKLVRLISNTKGIIHQRLLEKRGGGRIAVYEDLFFTSKMKMALYSRMSTGGDGVTDLIQEFVESHGVSLTKSIKEHFSLGHLTLSTSIDQIAEKLSMSDITWFEKETILLFKNGLISEEEMLEWIAEIDTYRTYYEQ